MPSFFATCPPPAAIPPAPAPPAGVNLTAGTIMVDAEIDSTDVEYVCNPNTGNYDLVSTRIVDGVAQAPTVTDSGMPCPNATTIEGVTELRFECFCDQAGDGSITAQYVRAFIVSVDGAGAATSTEVGDGWTDRTLSAAYTVAGTEVDCAEVGDAADAVSALKEDLSAGGTWAAPPLTQTIGIAVNGNGATVTDSDGDTHPLTTGRSYSWYSVNGAHFINTPFIVDAGGASVEITYTVLTSA